MKTPGKKIAMGVIAVTLIAAFVFYFTTGQSRNTETGINPAF